LTLARKSKCKKRFRTQYSSDKIAQKCEVNFFPLVYDTLHNSRSTNKILCRYAVYVYFSYV